MINSQLEPVKVGNAKPRWAIAAVWAEPIFMASDSLTLA